jgi:hypothetical protein
MLDDLENLAPGRSLWWEWDECEVTRDGETFYVTHKETTWEFDCPDEVLDFIWSQGYR